MTTIRTIASLLAVVAVAGCGIGSRDSGWNPLGWLGGGGRTQTLEPEGGYEAASTDPRQGIAQITGARWELLNEGRLLIVTGITPTKGYWDAELVPENPDPTDRLRPGPDGVLRLRFVAAPPPPDSVAARLPARPEVDTITTALTLPNQTLARMTEVVVTGATNAVSIRR
ncbi:hypothetical protein MLD63_05650 [Paracoccus sp. TK19116]|uniref:Uncharacterized protein n=1 Tax=Paracoccus albicereus TaxID=2922394 RepID=A0ABT1MNP3_9RHOB|nr:hypothetical protein [Paracoccus albicereus]MCQ0969908.1 hypothetical protein [Paracoccus albicereus]